MHQLTSVSRIDPPETGSKASGAEKIVSGTEKTVSCED